MALTDNLQGYWDLDETSGTRVDSTANGNDLTDTNTVLYGTGIIDNGADFTKSNSEYLTIVDGSQTGLDVTGDFTLQAWVKPETTPAEDSQWVMIGKISNGGGDGYGLYYIHYVGGVKKIRTVVSNGGFGAVEITHTLSTSAFTHLVFRFTSSTKEHSLWINGAESTGTGSKAIADTSANFSIGAGAGASGGGNYFDGLIDECAFWDRALSDSEIGELYNSGAGLAYPLTAGPSSSTSDFFNIF